MINPSDLENSFGPHRAVHSLDHPHMCPEGAGNAVMDVGQKRADGADRRRPFGAAQGRLDTFNNGH